VHIEINEALVYIRLNLIKLNDNPINNEFEKYTLVNTYLELLKIVQHATNASSTTVTVKSNIKHLDTLLTQYKFFKLQNNILYATVTVIFYSRFTHIEQ
jgi:hypothetical protein